MQNFNQSGADDALLTAQDASKKLKYSEITERILEIMRKGEIPWKNFVKGSGFPISRLTQKRYSLLNCILLGMRGGEYATFNQWKLQGGRVKKGAKGNRIYFWKKLEKPDEENPGVKKIIPILKGFYVFNIDDVEGVSQTEKEDGLKFSPIEPLIEVESRAKKYMEREKIQYREGFRSYAFYDTAKDLIHIPKAEICTNAKRRCAAIWHEIAHSTGAKNRLNRPELLKNSRFGSENYSREELTAEITSAFMMAECGISDADTEENAAAYLQNWMEALKNDEKLFVQAAGRAEKAVDFIMNGHQCGA